jgi:hypothetical protein
MEAKMQLRFQIDLPKIHSTVITPDYGPGQVEKILKPGDWEFDKLVFYDDGTQPTEPVIAVRTAQHRWCWYKLSKLTL